MLIKCHDLGLFGQSFHYQVLHQYINLCFYQCSFSIFPENIKKISGRILQETAELKKSLINESLKNNPYLLKNLILLAQCIWESCTISKINLNVFIFTLLYGVSKDFMKAFVKSFESHQRSVKTKSWSCFLFLFGLTGG